MSKDCCNNCKEGKTCCSETSIIEAKFTDDTLAPRIKHWASKHKGTGIGYGHVLGQLAVHMKEMGWNKSYKEVARVAVELGKKKKVESVNEGTKAFLAYREMKEALNVAIYGIKKMRKFIDDAPYNPKFNMITKELYKWEIDLEKKWRRVVPQISKISKDKMLEAAPMGRASVVGLSVNKDLVIPKNQMSKAKSQYKKMMNHLMKAGKSMTQPGEIDMMVSHMESAYDEMLALWKNVKEVKKESINEAGVDWKIKNKKVDAVLKGIIRSMGLKTVKDFGMGQSGISFFIDDEKEAKKLHKLLTKQMKNVRIINLDKSKGDVSNHVVYSRMFESEQVDEGFGSPELMKKKDLAEFEKTRQKNAEVLGYKLTGRPDHNHERKISVELENAKHTKKSKKTG